MTGVKTQSVQDDEDGMRLDRWFKVHFPDLSFGHLQKLLRKGQVRVNGTRAKTNTRLESGQIIRIPPIHNNLDPPNKKDLKVQKKLSKLDIEFIQSLVIHKDDDLIALNKPSGLAVQGGTKTEQHIDGMLDGLKFGYEESPRLVHRLDKDTSGVLLIARKRTSANFLSKALSGRKVKKIYWALVNGVPRYEEGEINVPLIKTGGRGNERVRIAERDSADKMSALTYYKVIDIAAQKLAWLALMPITGRTHQLRAHSLALGHPIVGDGKYAGQDAHPGGEIPQKLHLHAKSIEIPHPQKGVLKLNAELSDHMKQSWNLLNFDKFNSSASDFS